MSLTYSIWSCIVHSLAGINIILLVETFTFLNCCRLGINRHTILLGTLEDLSVFLSAWLSLVQDQENVTHLCNLKLRKIFASLALKL